jgi:putative restriction endonuclease
MALTREARIQRIVTGVEDGGGAVNPGFEPAGQPMGIIINGEDFRLFSWRISHGGKGRSPDEYRVQTTRPDDVPFLDPAVRTLLFGYHEELDVLAAWDARVHPNPSSSASLQVPLATLKKAAVDGIAAHPRLASGEEEVVVAFKPEAIGTYLEMASRLPDPMAGNADVERSARASNGEAVELEDLPSGRARRTEIREIEFKVRDERFRRRVISAYGGRCAFCGLDSGLVEAAHIQAVAAGGPDLIVNGLSTCPTHHAAFDRGLLVIGADSAIELNEKRFRARGASDADLERFRANLFPVLSVPAASEHRPDLDRLADHRRRWLAGL